MEPNCYQSQLSQENQTSPLNEAQPSNQTLTQKLRALQTQIDDKEHLISQMKKEIIALRTGSPRSQPVDQHLDFQGSHDLVGKLTHQNSELLSILLDFPNSTAMKTALRATRSFHYDTKELDKEIHQLYQELHNDPNISEDFSFQSERFLTDEVQQEGFFTFFQIDDSDQRALSPILKADHFERIAQQNDQLRKHLIEMEARLLLAQQKISGIGKSREILKLKKVVQDREGLIKQYQKEFNVFQKKKKRFLEKKKRVLMELERQKQLKEQIRKLTVGYKEREATVVNLKAVVKKQEDRIQQIEREKYIQKLQLIKTIKKLDDKNQSNQGVKELKATFGKLQYKINQQILQLHQKTEEIFQLKAQISMHEEMSNSDKIMEIQQELETMKELYAVTQQENDQLNLLNDELTEKIEEYKTSFDVSKELLQVKEQYSQLQVNYNKLIHETTEMDNLTEIIKQIQNQLECENSSFHSLSSDYKPNTGEDLLLMKSYYKDIEQKYQEEKKRAAALETEILVNERLHKTVQELHQKILDKESQLIVCQQITQQKETVLVEKRNQLAFCIEDVEGLLLQRQESNKKLETANQEKQQLEAGFQKAVEENLGLKEQAEASAVSIQELESKLEVAEQRVKNLQVELDQFQLREKVSQKRIQEAENREDSLKTYICQIQNKLQENQTKKKRAKKARENSFETVAQPRKTRKKGKKKVEEEQGESVPVKKKKKSRNKEASPGKEILSADESVPPIQASVSPRGEIQAETPRKKAKKAGKKKANTEEQEPKPRKKAKKKVEKEE